MYRRPFPGPLASTGRSRPAISPGRGHPCTRQTSSARRLRARARGGLAGLRWPPGWPRPARRAPPSRPPWPTTRSRSRARAPPTASPCGWRPGLPDRLEVDFGDDGLGRRQLRPGHVQRHPRGPAVGRRPVPGRPGQRRLRRRGPDRGGRLRQRHPRRRRRGRAVLRRLRQRRRRRQPGQRHRRASAPAGTPSAGTRATAATSSRASPARTRSTSTAPAPPRTCRWRPTAPHAVPARTWPTSAWTWTASRRST